MKYLGFEAGYLPDGWLPRMFQRFVDTQAGKYYIWRKAVLHQNGFSVPFNWSPPIPLFQTDGFDGNVLYYIFRDSSFLMITNGEDAVYSDVDDFYNEHSQELSESTHEHDLRLIQFLKFDSVGY